MDRLVDGDRSAFEPLYRALWPRALRVARRRSRVEESEDVAQSAMLRVFARAPEFERGRAVLPWFYAIVANEVRAHRTKSAPPVIDADTNVEDPESVVCARELTDALEHAIASLDRDAAESIHALLERGPRPNVSPASFRKRVSRAYARLRNLLRGSNV